MTKKTTVNVIGEQRRVVCGEEILEIIAKKRNSDSLSRSDEIETHGWTCKYMASRTESVVRERKKCGTLSRRHYQR